MSETVKISDIAPDPPNGNGNRKRLTNKQAVFIDEYLIDFNATQAAIRAGYSERSANNIGPGNLLKPIISDEIERRIAERSMTTDEALLRLADQARFDISDYIVAVGTFAGIDVEKMIKDGHGHLVRGITRTAHGVKVELADPDAALDKILKAGGAYVQRHELTGADGTELIVNVRYGEK